MRCLEGGHSAFILDIVKIRGCLNACEVLFTDVPFVILIKMLIGVLSVFVHKLAPVLAFDRLWLMPVLCFFVLRPSRCIGFGDSVIITWVEGCKSCIS